MDNSTLIIEDDNLSVAWGRLFVKISESGKKLQPTPLIIKISNNGSIDLEHPDIRMELDIELEKIGRPCVDTVANTIFPQTLYDNSRNRETFYERYIRMYPRIKKYRWSNNSPNKFGTYFGRMIAFGFDRSGNNKETINQLENVIEYYIYYDKIGKSFRLSGLLTSIFDPFYDSSKAALRGFPCLHQVQFHPDRDSGVLSVTGLYPTQYVFSKAYGNYLGLWRLGEFVAAEIGLKMGQLVCVILKPELELTKNRLKGLREAVLKSLPNREG
jgi:hypothetical protein